MTAIAVCLTAAGCQSYPESPSGSFDVSGNYKAVSDCSYLKIRSGGYWKKEEFESMRTVQLTLGNETTAIGRIDFTGITSGRTRVEVRFPTPIQGKDYYPNIYRKIAESCSA
ncbi:MULTISPECIES: hypothetical protein [unclassified Mesorhizobium]|uniref:hypothetical protein n=1 Tax=unclassified Mesorhizobium TaxID=325217 RepID=UPI000FD3B563|nr:MULTISPECIES: hypothetical protein [unclassified Mesorhizobium]RVB76351.1 hypothetical protein EN885_16575 [Mesorhizobium sp. M6A.T.Cr.TU.014.01.1.1]RWQ04434.1 MAG: hypothetical protein EOR91_17550 [Mesorhizobium sp.]RWQ04708.1 MAG: hypothetical protein EOR90_15655 [Mesorhizobium sp.]